jgi:hypothetical protein
LNAVTDAAVAALAVQTHNRWTVLSLISTAASGSESSTAGAMPESCA